MFYKTLLNLAFARFNGNNLLAKRRKATEVIEGASLVAQLVKNPPVIAGDIRIWVLSLGREDPQEEGMETHSNILAWRIPRTEEPGGLQSTGLQRVGQD